MCVVTPTVAMRQYSYMWYCSYRATTERCGLSRTVVVRRGSARDRGDGPDQSRAGSIVGVIELHTDVSGRQRHTERVRHLESDIQSITVREYSTVRCAELQATQAVEREAERENQNGFKYQE